MRDGKLYEYAVIRVVPRVEREEFINVGVVLYCRDGGFLQAKYALEQKRLQAFCAACDYDLVASYITAFAEICRGENPGSPISQLEPAGRFRWLTAQRSTMVQTSRVHPGICDEPSRELDKLFESLVG